MNSDRPLKNPLGYALVGCGYVCERHLAAIKSLSGASLVAVCDANPDRARNMAALFDIPVVETDYDRLLQRPDIDVVVLTIPTPLHESFTVKAATHGKHVLVEKPIAYTLESAQRMIDACRYAGVRLGVGHSHRYFPLSRSLKELLRDGKLGAVHKVRAFHCCFDEIRNENRSWKLESETERLLDIGIHYADSLRYILGKEAHRVFASIRRIRRQQVPIKEEATGLIDFAGNTIAIFEISASQHMDDLGIPCEGLELYGEHGTLHASVLEGTVKGYWIDSEGRRTDLNQAEVPNWDVVWESLHREFLESVLNNRVPVPISGEEGYKTLEIMEAIFQSSEQKAPLAVPIIAAPQFSKAKQNNKTTIKTLS